MSVVVKRRTGGAWRTLSGAIGTTTAPDPPSIVNVVPGDGEAAIHWSTPDSGGSAITGFTVTSSPGGLTASGGGGATSATVTGLTNNTAYTFTVTATNAIGTSPASAASASATPASSGAAITRRTAANTGIAGVGLTTGDLTVWDCATAGRDIPSGSYDRDWFKNIPTAVSGAGLRLLANSMAFTKCVFTGANGWANPIAGTRYLINRGPGSVGAAGSYGHTFTDCLIDGGGTMSTTALSASYIAAHGGSTTPDGNACMSAFQPGMTYTLTRCHLKHFEHHLQPQDVPVGKSIMVDACMFSDVMLVQYSTDTTHSDGMQVAGTGTRNLTVRYSTIDLYNASGASEPFQIANTAVLAMWGSFPLVGGVKTAVIQDVDIYGNYFDGGANLTHLNKLDGLAVCQNFNIRDNRIGVHMKGITETPAQRTSAVDGGTVNWSNNVWDVDGTTLNSVAVLAGQVIP